MPTVQSIQAHVAIKRIAIASLTRLQLHIESGRLVIEKKIQLDLTRWVGKAVDDGLTTSQALAELRGRPVPWQAEDAQPDAAAATKPASR